MSPSNLLWVVLPYAAIFMFVVGHIWRFHRDRFGWARPSTQEFRKGLRCWECPLFHYAAIAAIIGHSLGILIPRYTTEWLGISDAEYHLVSSTVGSVLGIAAFAGLAMLAWQRATIAPKRARTTWLDIVAYTALFVVIGLGSWNTIAHDLLGGGYDYRASVAPWFRSVLRFQPNPALMSSAPISYQLHVLAAWILLAIWPYTRLVHAWSMSLAFVLRAIDAERRRLDGWRGVEQSTKPH